MHNSCRFVSMAEPCRTKALSGKHGKFVTNLSTVGERKPGKRKATGRMKHERTCDRCSKTLKENQICQNICENLKMPKNMLRPRCMNLQVSRNVQAYTRFIYDVFSKNNREKLRRKDIIREQESHIKTE